MNTNMNNTANHEINIVFIETDISKRFSSKFADFETADKNRLLPTIVNIIKSCLVSDSLSYHSLISKFLNIKDNYKHLDDEEYIANAIINEYKNKHKNFESMDNILQSIHSLSYTDEYTFHPRDITKKEIIIKNSLLLLHSLRSGSLSVGMFDYDNKELSPYQNIVTNGTCNGIYRITLKLCDISEFHIDNDIEFHYNLLENIGITSFIDKCDNHSDFGEWWYRIAEYRESQKNLKNRLQIESEVELLKDNCILPKSFKMRRIYPTTDVIAAFRLISSQIVNAVELEYPNDIVFKKQTKTGFDIEYKCKIKLSNIILNEQERISYIQQMKITKSSLCDYIDNVCSQFSFDIFDYSHMLIDKQYDIINLSCIYNAFKYDSKLKTNLNRIASNIIHLKEYYSNRLAEYYSQLEIDIIDLKKKNELLEKEQNIKSIEN